MPFPPGLKAADLTVRYPGRSAPVLEKLSLALHEGERVLLLGPSGAGKSTLLLTLTGLIPHALFADVQGDIEVNGRDPRVITPAALCRDVSVLFQDPDTQLCMPTVEEEIAFGLENLGVPRDAMEARIRTALHVVGLTALRTMRQDRLSGGQRQRLALAAVLAMEAPLLLLDEPTAHLDPKGTREFFESLRRLTVKALLLVEHRLEHVVSLIDRVIALGSSGQVFAEGPPRNVFHHHAGALTELGIWLPPAVALARVAGVGEPWLTSDDVVASAQEAPAIIGKVLEALPRSRAPVGGERLAIEVQDLTHAYSPGIQALHRASLRVPEGDFLALVGANGSGKTTLALHLVGILPPPPGRIRVLGHDMAHLSAREISALIGYVFQNPEHQFVTDTVLDEVRYTFRARGVQEPEASVRAREALQRFGMAEVAGLHPYQLSQGAKRRLSVLTVLVMPPRVLILDEPTFGQDARTSQHLLGEMVQLNEQGLTILMITHDMDAVWRFARSVAIMEQGRITYQGPVMTLSQQADRLGETGLDLPFAARLHRALTRRGAVVS